MTFDGITTRAVISELNNKIVQGAIKKINQVGPKQLTFQIYAKQVNQQLFISADSSSARFHLSSKKYENPQTPPNFVMLLRKHLGQARIEAVDQLGLDRTVRIVFSTRNELGDEVEKYLIIEIMGKHSNIILLDEHKRVIEAIQRVSHDMSRVRQIYPGKDYQIFPANKLDLDKDAPTARKLIEEEGGSGAVFKVFYRRIAGFSPVMGREICFRSSVDPMAPVDTLSTDEIGRLEDTFQAIRTDILEERFEPTMYLEPKKEYYCFPLYHLGPAEIRDVSISHIIDETIELSHRQDRIGQQRDRLLGLVTAHIDKQEKKLADQIKDFELTKDRDTLKLEADLLAAHIHLIRKGMTEIEVPDFYNDNRPRLIALDEKKSAWDNVNSKYHRSTKLKTAHQLLSERIPKLQEDIDYLRQLALTIREADSVDLLEEIQEELVKLDLVRQKKNCRKKKEKRSKPHLYLSPEGNRIYVGRNNVQNDFLTLKLAVKGDYFFHAKTIAGAHVILKTEGKTPTEDDLRAAAWLAAIYSSNKEEDYVDIDYTDKKNVYKAKGAKPGMVYYNDYQTIRISTKDKPDLSRLEETSD